MGLAAVLYTTRHVFEVVNIRHLNLLVRDVQSF